MGIPVVSTVARKVFGTRNDRLVKRYLSIVDKVSSHESEVRLLDDAALHAKTEEFKKRYEAGEKTVDLQPEAFAVAREAMDRAVGIRAIFSPDAGFDPSVLPAEARSLYEQTKAAMDAAEPLPPNGALLGNTQPVPAWLWMHIPLPLYEAVREVWPESRPPFRARPFDVQIIGGMVLYEGRIAEMKTGEGKTIVAPLSCYLSVIEGKQVHLVTVNEYLVQRDRDWMFPFFHALGMTVGAIHPQHRQPPQLKQVMYHCDVIYGTTSEFGFDFLRDNMKMSAAEQVQKHRQIAIVDEVDSTLVDEARTPLIISGPAHDTQPRYELSDRLAKHLLALQLDWNSTDEQVQKCLVDISSLEGDIRNARDRSDVPQLKERLSARKAELPVIESKRDRHTQYYEVELDKKRATLTHDGITEAQKESGLGSFYVGENIDIAKLVSETLSSRASIQRIADKVSGIFVPAVLAVALLTIGGWTIRAAVLDDWSLFSTGIIATVTVLIISCPCALGLATPMAIMVGTGEAGRRGILIKSAAALERAGRITRVVFDKTGTLTEGRPIVTIISPEPGTSENELLRVAGAAERDSEHPVARAIREVVAARSIEVPLPTNFIAVPGSGVTANSGGSRC